MLPAGLRRTMSVVAPKLWRGLGVEALMRRHVAKRTIGPGHALRQNLQPVSLHVPNWPIDNDKADIHQPYETFHRRFEGRSFPWQMGVVQLTDAKLSYPSGVHTSREGVMLEAYANPAILGNPKYSVPQAMLSLQNPKQHHGEAYLLYSSWGHNFYNWMLNVLPRMRWHHADPELNKLPLVMWKGAPRFVKASMAIMAPDSEILWLDAGQHGFSKLAVPCNDSNPMILSGEALGFLRDVYAPKALASCADIKPLGIKRLYISRSDSAIRRVINEQALEAELAKLGFQSVVMSEYSVAEQARLFAQADWIVAPHGAAFANLAFCRPGTKVLEIFQNGHRSRSFYTMSGLLGLPYGFAVGAEINQDTQVDIPALLAQIERMDRAT